MSKQSELDEMIYTCDFVPELVNSGICRWCGESISADAHTLKQAILDWHKQEIAKARIDEWGYIHETLHEAHMNAVSYSTEVMQDRIAELSQTLKEGESS